LVRVFLASMNKPSPPPETLGSVPLNAGQSSNGKPYGGFTINGKWVPNAVGELRKEVDPEGRIGQDEAYGRAASAICWTSPASFRLRNKAAENGDGQVSWQRTRGLRNSPEAAR
jgi:hypothetical protein